ncbi:hypothetical protein ACGVWS_00845 [Enterobacteriaceae bacterium LUAb1]
MPDEQAKDVTRQIIRGYRMEQQAQIIADYFWLTRCNGCADWGYYTKCKNCGDLSDDALVRQDKDTLRGFPKWQP